MAYTPQARNNANVRSQARNRHFGRVESGLGGQDAGINETDRAAATRAKVD